MNMTNEEYIQFLRGRISPNVKPEIAELMIEYAMTQEEHAEALMKVDELCFANRIPARALGQTPKAFLVISQTGGGKSALTAKILRENPNTIVIDSDKFKQFHSKRKELLEKYPTLFGFLTGLDAYLLRDEIYSKALAEGYNILIEIAPSAKDKLFNINFEELSRAGYTVDANLLVTCIENSLLSIHERYELDLRSGKPAPKLTDFNRAIESSVVIPEIIEDFQRLPKEYNTTLTLWQRGPYSSEKSGSLLVNPPIFVSSDLDTALFRYSEAEQADREDMLPHLKDRVERIESDMEDRNAPTDQRSQFEKVKDYIEEKSKSLK